MPPEPGRREPPRVPPDPGRREPPRVPPDPEATGCAGRGRIRGTRRPAGQHRTLDTTGRPGRKPLDPGGPDGDHRARFRPDGAGRAWSRDRPTGRRRHGRGHGRRERGHPRGGPALRSGPRRDPPGARARPAPARGKRAGGKRAGGRDAPRPAAPRRDSLSPRRTRPAAWRVSPRAQPRRTRPSFPGTRWPTPGGLPRAIRTAGRWSGFCAVNGRPARCPRRRWCARSTASPNCP